MLIIGEIMLQIYIKSSIIISTEQKQNSVFRIGLRLRSENSIISSAILHVSINKSLKNINFQRFIY